jgi:hypothetical protein|tara:strand:+ start:126589 stop:127113 length:525 start_codon:yes stop_codon:yes gene_type:complete
MKKFVIIILTFPITLVLYILLFSGNIKYSEEIVIDSNIDKVIELFDNPQNMKQYIYGFESYTVINGNKNEIGTISEININFNDNGKKESKIIMTEEIISNNLPIEKKLQYTSNGILNIVTNRFEKISEYETRFINEQEFVFNTYMKLLFYFSKSSLKYQTKMYLNNFKDFVENQ